MHQAAPIPRSRTLPALTLLILVIGAALAVVPSGSTQVIVSFASDDADRTFGWTFPDGSSPDAELTDPAGDQSLVTGAAPSLDVPPDAVAQDADITGLTIHEIDAELLFMRLSVADLAVRPEQSLDRATYDIRFDLGGATHRVSGWLDVVCGDPEAAVCEPFTDPVLAFRADLERATPDGEWQPSGIPPTRVLVDEDTIEILLPRWALDRPGSRGAHPIAGDAITNLQVTARTGTTIMGGAAETSVIVQDQLPDEAAATNVYTLKQNSAGSIVSLTLAGLAEPSEANVSQFFGRGPPLEPRQHAIDVDMQQASRIGVEVHNRFQRSALVVPEITLTDAPAGLTARAVQSLAVPGGATRGFDIILGGNITPDPDLTFTVNVDIHTLGSGTAFTDTLALQVHHAPALAPDNNRLYLHTVGANSFAPADTLPTTMLTFTEGALNTREDDPNDNEIGSTLGLGCICGDQVTSWAAAVTSLDPLFLDTQGNITFHATIDAPVAGVLLMEAFLFYDDIHVGDLEATEDLAQGSNEITLTFPVQEGAKRLPPAQHAFQFEIFSAFRPGANVPLAELSNLAHAANPRLETGGTTWLELPIIDRAERFADVDHLAVDLQRGYESVQYVNPGRAALWNVTVLNQGDKEDTISVQAEADAAGWTTDTRPGRSFQLAPGDSITVGVLGRAGSDAAEGDTARINVTVTSELAKGNGAGMRLTAVVTDGIAIEEGEYIADNETQERVITDKERKGTPGPGAAWLVLCLGLLAMRRRRARVATE